MPHNRNTERTPDNQSCDTKPRRRGKQQKGLIYIKKLAFLLATAILVYSICVQAFAVTVPELEEQVSACRLAKDTAHQMAECARQLGFPDDHIIIQTAKEKWMEAYTEELNLMGQIEELQKPKEAEFVWNGPVLTRSKGVNYGPTGKETYYNLPMQGVVRIMRNKGYSESEYPYWIRSDGVKMLGPYVIAAANFGHFPRGSIVPSSLGFVLVCDTGHLGWNHLDLATNW